MRTEDRSENRLESINGNSILLGTNFQGEKLVLATDYSVGATVELRERLYGGFLANKHILNGMLKLQEHKLKGEQRDEEEAELNHEGHIEFCQGTLWEGDQQSQETLQGGRKKPRTQPWRPRTQSRQKE